MVEIEKLSSIFSKVAANLQQPLDPPPKQSITKSAPMPHKLRPTRATPFPLERPNIIEDDNGNSHTDFQLNFHISSSGPHIILPDVPISLSRAFPAQPLRVDTGGPRSNLRSSCKKNTFPNFAFAEKFLQVRKADTVTHQISGVAQ